MIEKDYRPRVVVITGGGTGIGRAMAETFTKHGDHAVIIGRREEVLRGTAQVIGPNCSWQRADVGVLDEVAAAVGAIVANFGHIDVLVNNAGYNREMNTEMTLEQAREVWDEMLRSNLTGAFQMAFAALPYLARPGGRIINISSDAAFNGGAGMRTLGYVAAKAGLHGLTRSLAQVYSPEGITVNTISVGFVRDSEGNQRLPDDVVKGIASHLLVRRPGHASDIAAAAFFLASSEASYITADVLTVNGGRFSF